MKKSSILRILSTYSEEINLNDFFDKLAVTEKIDRGLKSIKTERTISHKKIKNEFLKTDKTIPNNSK